MKNHLFGAIVAAGLALAPAANASQYITNLEYTQDGLASSPLGTVTLTEGAGYVDILVAFTSQIQNIVDTGGHVSFAFNLVDSGGNAVDPVTFQLVQPLGDPDYHYGNVAGGDYDQSPFKNFTNAVTNSSHERGNGNNATPPPLEFKLYAPGISFLGAGADHFRSTIGGGVVDGFTGGWWFAADVQTAPGVTGFSSQTFTVAGRDFCTVGIDCTPGVPEPATWGLMLLGFGGVGALLRRSRRIARMAVA